MPNYRLALALALSLAGCALEAEPRVELPPPEPVVAIAIGNTGRVYTWYSDETLSIGTSDDLGRYDDGVAYSLAQHRDGLRPQRRPRDRDVKT
jgi:hypothetical protein